MTTEEALRVVESVLNEYRGIKRLEEILEPVMQAEIRVIELGTQVNTLLESIAQLDLKKAAVAEASAAALVAAVAEHEEVMGSLGKVEAAKRSEIKDAEAALYTLRARYDELNGSFNEHVELNAAHIRQLESEVAVATKRLAKIEAKIAQLKGM